MASETPRAPTDRGGRRSVKIGDQERSAYSSDRTRRGEPIGDRDEERGQSVRRARGRRLNPSNRISYSPSSVIVLAGAAGVGKTTFADRLFDKGSVAVLSIAKIQRMIAGAPEGPEARAQAVSLIGQVAAQRLRAGQSVVIDGRALDPEERRELVLVAQRARRPAHLIFLEGSREQLEQGGASEQDIEHDLPLTGELRRAVEQDRLGEEGFSTVLTLTRRAAEQVRQIGFDLDLRAPGD
jgi:predicted kinase